MKIISSFNYAFNGIKSAVLVEKNFTVQLILGILSIILGVVLHINKIEWVVIILCNGMVLAFELINSVIEKICNFIHGEKDPQIKIIKDMAAGAVLLTAITSVIIAFIIFFPKILNNK